MVWPSLLRKRQAASAAWGSSTGAAPPGGKLVHLRAHRGRLGHVLEGALAVLGRPARPAALLTLGALREVHEPVGYLAHLSLLGEVGRHRRLLQAVLLEFLYGGEPLVLVHGVAS